jgi:RNA polymerase primary sigma factor
MPLNQVGFQSKLSKAIVSFEQEFERRPSPQELADILETDINKVMDALGTNGKKVSVDAPFQDDDTNCLIDVMHDDSAPGTDDQMERESLSSDLDAALSTLSDREREVLKMLFGIGRNEMTAEEVANNMNLTRERVRQIKERALRRLREAENINILLKYLGR